MAKTLHLTNAYHAPSGRIRTFYRRLLAEGSSDGREMVLIAPGTRDAVERIGEHARIHHVGAPRSPWFDPDSRRLLPPQLLMPWRGVARIVREERPDLVEVCDKYSLCYLAGLIRKGWLRGLRSRPVLVGLTCERMDDNVDQYLHLGAAGRRWSDRYMRYIYVPQFDAHIAVSRYTAEEVERQAPRHARRVDVLGLGVDSDHFNPHRRSETGRQRLLRGISGGPDSRLLLYAGRISPEKNIELLTATMARLAEDTRHDYHLLVAGSGPLSDRFASTAQQQVAGRVHLLGHLNREQLADTLANADAFVHPNPREPFGLGPLEAMASGLPLIGPDRGGIVSYACARTAWLIEPEAEAFASMVRHVFADTETETRASKIAAALQRAAGYTWPHAAARFFRLYDELIAIRRARGAAFGARDLLDAQTGA